MRILFILIVILSLAINIYCWLIWIWSYAKYATHAERIACMQSYLPFQISMPFLGITLVVFNIVGLIVVNTKFSQKTLTVPVSVLLLLFLALNVSQLI